MKKYFLTAFLALTALAASAKSYVVFSGDPLTVDEEQISMNAFNNWNPGAMTVSDYQTDATSPDGKSVKCEITQSGTWSGGGWANNGFDMGKIKALSPLKLKFQYKASSGSTTSWRFKFVDCTPEVEYVIPGIVKDGQWHEMEIDVNQANEAWGPALSSGTYWVLTVVGQETHAGDTFELTDVRFTDGEEVVSPDPKVGVTASTSSVTETSATLNYNITGTNVADGTTYDVTVAVNGTEVATLSGVSAGANTYELTDLAAGTAYSVKVTATATVDGNAVSGQTTTSFNTLTPPPSSSVDTWVVFSGDALGSNEYQLPLGSFDNWNTGNMSKSEGSEGDGKSATFTITGTNDGWAGAGWYNNGFDFSSIKSDALKLMFSYKATGTTRWIIKFTATNNAPEVEVDVPGLNADGKWHDAVINVPSAAAAWFNSSLANNNVKHAFAVVGLSLNTGDTFTVSNVRYTVGDGSSTPDTKDPFVKVTASVTNISDNSATLNYNIAGTNVPSGTKYAVTVTVNGKENQFSNISAGANTLTLPGLAEGTTYDIKVAATATVDGNAVTGEAATSFTTTKPSAFKVGNVWRGTVKLTASSDPSKTATIDYEVTALEGGNVEIAGVIREGLPTFNGLVKQIVVDNQFYDLVYNAAENELSYTTSGKNFVLGESKVPFMFRFAYAGGIFTETMISDYVYGAANEVAKTPYVVLSPRVSEVTANSAKVGYVVEVKNAPVGTKYTVTVNGTETTDNPYLLTGLEPNTEQTVKIKATAVVDGQEYSEEKTVTFTTLNGEAFYWFNAVETKIGNVSAIAEVKVFFNTGDNKIKVSGNLHTATTLTGMQPLYLDLNNEARQTMGKSTVEDGFEWVATCTGDYSKGAAISKLQFFVVSSEGNATIQFPTLTIGDTSEDRHANVPKDMTVTIDNSTAFKVGESRPYTVAVKDGYGFVPVGKKVVVDFAPAGVFSADGSQVTALKGGTTEMGVTCGGLHQTFTLEAKTGYTAEVVFTNEPRTINNMNVNVITMTPSLLIDEMPATEGQASAFKLMLDGVEVSTGIAPVHGFELRTGGEFSYVSGDVTVPVTVKWPQIGATPEVKSVLYWEDDASKALDATDFYVNADYLLGPAVNPGNYHWVVKDESGNLVTRWKNGWMLHYQPRIGRKTGDVVTLIEGISLPAYEVVYPYAVRRQAPAAAQGMRRAAADDSEFEVRYARGIMPEGSNTVAPIVTSDVPEAFKPTSGSVSGVEGVTIEGSNAEYFTLDGVRVSGEHLTPGVYICRQGLRTTKIMVK